MLGKFNWVKFFLYESCHGQKGKTFFFVHFLFFIHIFYDVVMLFLSGSCSALYEFKCLKNFLYTLRLIEMNVFLGRKIAIDASMSIYQFLIAVRAEGSQLTNEAGETTRYKCFIYIYLLN